MLKIVGEEFTAKGVCGLCIDAIAARAGVCRRLAQGVIRMAEGDGLLTIQKRRHQGRKSDPSLVRIISREWQAWLKRGTQTRNRFASQMAPKASASIGCRKIHPTDKELTSGTSSPAEPSQGCRGAAGDPRESGPSRSRAGDRSGRAMR